MTEQKQKPEPGETYFVVSEYANEPYQFVWQGTKQNRDHLMHKTHYRTREEAETVIKQRVEQKEWDADIR